MTLDDVGAAYVLFHAFAKVGEFFAARSQGARSPAPGDAGGGPEEHLGRAMVGDHLSVHMRGIDAEIFSEMETETRR
jgi:hypothetical protein